MTKKVFLLAAVLAVGAAAWARSPWRVPVNFSYTTNTGDGYSLYLVGNHPDLGSWNPAEGVLLTWTDGNVWTTDVGVQAGTELAYKFVKRSTAPDVIADGNNAEWMEGDDLTLSVAAEPDAPYEGKRVVFLCPWDEPVQLVYSMLSKGEYEATNEWHAVDMVKTGDGRYELDGVGEAGEWMRFTFSGYDDGEQKWYHFYGTEGEDFWTPLDAFCVTAGQVFNYEPEGDIADSYIVTTNVGSSFDGIAGRDVRIYLPRGYDAQTNRSYPVVYFSDGQNVFQPGGSYGCWDAETVADREIRGGRMREAILVAVPCRETAPDGYSDDYAYAGRLWEYLPSCDKLMGTDLQGLGESYANFLVHNVRPTIDCHFRTRNGYEDTAHIGSSAGGLLSMYLGTCTNVFGLIGAMSGVYNEEYCPNFRARCLNESLRSGKKTWLDTGTEETSIDGLDLYASNFNAYYFLVYAGHVPNKDLKFFVASGSEAGAHNEPAWNARLWRVFDFLLDIRDEGNPLLPCELTLANDGTVSFPAYGGTTYSIKRTDDLVNPAPETVWQADGRTEKPWGTTNSVALDGEGFYWLEGE